MYNLKKLILGLLICLLVFVSCDTSGPKNSTLVGNNPTPVGLKELPEDDVKAITSIGTVTGVYGDEGLKYINGQEINGFTDAEGNTMTLKFTSKLVSYSKLNPEILAYVSSLETANAKMHHGYNGIKWNANDIYVEYCTYRFEGNKDQKRNGNICFIEIRIFQGNFREQYEGGKQYYAKSVLFDPDLKYDLNKRIEISTGKRLEKYDPYTNKVTFEQEKVYRTLDTDPLDSVIKLFPKNAAVYADRDKNGKLIVCDYSNVKYPDANGLYSVVLVIDKEDIEKGSKCETFINSLLEKETSAKFMRFTGNPVYNFETQYILNIYLLLDNKDGIIGGVSTRLMTDGTVDKRQNYYASSCRYSTIDDLINLLK